MENTAYLYETLLRVLGQHSNWLDLRHRKTLAWMMVGLICSKTVSLGAWTPFVISQAQYAQSLVRRFSRWLDNNRITVEPLYGPLIAKAVVGWVGKRMYVALDLYSAHYRKGLCGGVRQNLPPHYANLRGSYLGPLQSRDGNRP